MSPYPTHVEWSVRLLLLRLLFAAGLWASLTASAQNPPDCTHPKLRLLGGGILSPCNTDDYPYGELYGSSASYNVINTEWTHTGPLKVYPGGVFSPPREAFVTLDPIDTCETRATVTLKLQYRMMDPLCGDTETVHELTKTVEYEIRSNCGGSGGDCTGGGCNWRTSPGTTSIFNSGVNARFSLGGLSDLEDAGFLSIYSALPSAGTASPSGLKYDFNRAGVFVYPATGTLQQVKTPETLARVVDSLPNDWQYVIEFFYSQDVTWSGTIYVPNGGAQPFVTWTVRNPSGNINIVEIIGSNGDTYTFSYDSPTGKWTLAEPGALRSTVYWTSTSGVYVDKYNEVWSAGNLVSRTWQRYKTINGSRYLSQTVLGQGTTETTTYTLIESGDGIGRPSRIDYPDGRWEIFEYDDYGRILKKYETFADMPPPAAGQSPAAGTCRRTTYLYEALDTSADKLYDAGSARDTTVEVPKYDSPSQAWVWVVVSRRFFWTPDLATRKEAWSLRPGVAGCAWDDPENLVTTTVVFGLVSRICG
jgi:hypothetical protein